MLITDVHSKQRFCLVKISPIFHLLVTHAQKKPEDEKKTGDEVTPSPPDWTVMN